MNRDMHDKEVAAVKVAAVKEVLRLALAFLLCMGLIACISAMLSVTVNVWSIAWGLVDVVFRSLR